MFAVICSLKVHLWLPLEKMLENVEGGIKGKIHDFYFYTDGDKQVERKVDLVSQD